VVDSRLGVELERQDDVGKKRSRSEEPEDCRGEEKVEVVLGGAGVDGGGQVTPVVNQDEGGEAGQEREHPRPKHCLETRD
jgi:hypothetical protein